MAEVRGLMLPAELTDDHPEGAPALARRALVEQRLVINAPGPTTLRFLPPDGQRGGGRRGARRHGGGAQLTRGHAWMPRQRKQGYGPRSLNRSRIGGQSAEPGSVASESEFSPGEVTALEHLRGSLKRVAEWPPDSPLSFVLMLAPRTRGKLGETLLAQIALDVGLTVGKPESVAYDVRIGKARCEVKFSTEDPPRFQQVRDPREAGATKYDYLARDARTASCTG